MKYFSAFSGIGGFELGITQARIDLMSEEKIHIAPFECVGYSEIDKHAIEIYQKIFPQHKLS